MPVRRVALYLIGNVAFRLRMVGTIGYEKIVVAAAVLAVYAVGTALAAWAIAMVLAALLGVLCVVETVRDREVPDRD